jgi:hypothetical protein
VTTRRGRLVVPCAILLLILLASCTSSDGGDGGPSRDEGGPVAAGPRQVVVAPGGDDDAPGTEQRPWRTLRASLSRLRPGDTLLVRDGRYEEKLDKLSIRPGRPDARITVAAYPGERPVLAGLLSLHRPSYWTVRGLRITWGRGGPHDHMVKITDGVGWRLEASELWGARSFAALLVAGTRSGEPADWAVAGNCIHDTIATNGPNRDQLVYVNTGLDPGRGLLEGNLLFGAANGSGVKLGGSAEDEGGAAKVTVRHNTIVDTAQGVLVAWRSHDNTIEGNLIGRTGSGYAAVRGFELTGARNVADGTAAFDTTAMIANDDGFRGVQAGTNRFPVDPGFGPEAGCDGFRPSAAGLEDVGRGAAGSG